MLTSLYRGLFFLRRNKRLLQTLIAVPAFVLGYIACRERFAGHEWYTIMYRTLQMFALELDPIDDPAAPSDFDISAKFAIAHWLAMILAASVVFEVLVHFSAQRMTSLLVGLFGMKHVIVCGLGQHSLKLIEKLQQAGYFVAVIEADEEHPDLELCRERGAVVFQGDPSSATVLRKASIATAGHVLSLFHPDDRNYEVARTVHELCETRHQPLDCTIQIRDRSLLEILNQEDLKTNTEDQFELEVFHSDELLARGMLREASWASTSRVPRRMLVLLANECPRTAETFLVRAARDWLIEADSTDERMEITLVGENASAIESRLAICFPEVMASISIRVIDRNPESWGSLERSHDSPLIPELYDVAFVLSEREERTLVGVNLMQRLSGGKLPIIVNAGEASRNFRRLLPRDPVKSTAKQHVIAANLRYVSVDQSVFDVRTVLSPESELLARSCHQDYLIDHLLRHDRAKPAVTPWEELSESHKQANRALANRLGNYISGRSEGTRTLQRRFVSDRPIRLFSFTSEEIETLAREEHREWMRERARGGWRFGDVRDDQNKLHPNMLEWDDPRLTEETKELDRNIIQRIPKIYAKMDLELSVAE